MIDSSQPVRLLRHVHHNGNFYHPREYSPGELPSEFLVEGVVTQSPLSLQVFSPMSGSFESTEININVENTNINQTSFKKVQQPLIMVSKVQVNQATIDVLSSLAGITVPTARKVVEEYQKTPFKDLQDLSDRVPFPKGGKWDSLAEQLVF